jgi:hypothetical protein
MSTRIELAQLWESIESIQDALQHHASRVDKLTTELEWITAALQQHKSLHLPIQTNASAPQEITDKNENHKVFKPPGPCMNTDKEENRKMREKIVLYTQGDQHHEIIK